MDPKFSLFIPLIMLNVNFSCWFHFFFIFSYAQIDKQVNRYKTNKFTATSVNTVTGFSKIFLNAGLVDNISE